MLSLSARTVVLADSFSRVPSARLRSYASGIPLIDIPILSGAAMLVLIATSEWLPPLGEVPGQRTTPVPPGWPGKVLAADTRKRRVAEGAGTLCGRSLGMGAG